MELLDRVQQALQEAIRDRNEDGRNALRLLLTAIKVKEKETRRPLSEVELQQVIATQIKQRRDSVEQFLRADRKDLAERETEEIAVLQGFLPEALTPEALERLIEEAIAEVGATAVKEMGKVMKVLMPRIAGRADGKRVNEITRGKLGG